MLRTPLLPTATRSANLISLPSSSLFSFSKTPPQPDFSISMNRRPILWKERILPTLGAIYPVLASISQDLNRLNAFPPLLPNSNSFRILHGYEGTIDLLSRDLSGSDSCFRIIEVREFMKVSISYRCGIIIDDFFFIERF